MAPGADAVKGTMEVLVSKAKGIGVFAPTPKPCECTVKASISKLSIRIHIPDKNIIIDMRFRDILGVINAATERYNVLRTQENFRKVMNMENGGHEK